MISVIVFKMGKHSDVHVSFIQIEVTWRDFTVVTKLMKNFKSLYGFGGRCLKIRDVCIDFEPNFKKLLSDIRCVKNNFNEIIYT